MVANRPPALEEASKKRLLNKPVLQNAQMSEVGSYVDMLYEEIDAKIKGTNMILQVMSAFPVPDFSKYSSSEAKTTWKNFLKMRPCSVHSPENS